MPKASKIEVAVKAFLDHHPADQLAPLDQLPPCIECHPTWAHLARQCGFVSFAEQSFWLCNPEEWQEVARPWLEPGAAAADVVIRTAFGEMFVWDGVFFWVIMPHQSARIRLTEHSEWLIRKSLTNPDMSYNSDLPRLVKRARKTCGPLASHEMYTFVPALALGGNEKTSPIVKADLRETLSTLHKVSPPRHFGL